MPWLRTKTTHKRYKMIPKSMRLRKREFQTSSLYLRIASKLEIEPLETKVPQELWKSQTETSCSLTLSM